MKQKLNEPYIISNKISELQSLRSNKQLIIDSIFSSLNVNDLQAAKLLFKLLPNYKEYISSERVFNFLTFLVKYDQNYDLIKFTLENISEGAVTVRGKEIGATLLDEAVSYGALKNTKLLLEKGANKVINNQDIDGNTPLLKAIKYDYFEIVELLLQHKANPNIAQGGYSPLGYAMVHQNDKMKIALLKAGANKVTKNLDAIKEQIKKGVITLSKPQLPPVILEEGIKLYHEAIASYYKGLFSENKKVVNFLNDAITKLKKSIQIDSKNKQLDTTKLLMLCELHSAIISDQSDGLDKFIIKITDEWKSEQDFSVDTVACQLYNILSVRSLNVGDVFLALEYANKAKNALNEILRKDPNSQNKEQQDLLAHNTYFNLGTTLTPINRAAAVENLQQALEYKAGDLDTLTSLHELLCALGKTEDEKQILQSVPNQNDRDLLSVHKSVSLTSNSNSLSEYHFHPRFNNVERLGESKDALEGIYHNIKIQDLIIQSDFDRAVKYCSKIFENTTIYTFIENSSQVALHIVRLLNVYSKSNNFIGGAKALEEIYTQFPILKNHTHPYLKYYEFIILQGAGQDKEAAEILEFFNSKIGQGDLIDSLAFNVKKMSLCNAIENEDFAKATKCLSYFNDEEINIKAIEIFLETLAQAKAQKQTEDQEIDSLVNTPQITKQDDVSNETLLAIDLTVQNITLEPIETQYDAIAIHQYFQKQKKALIEEHNKFINQHQEQFSWVYFGKNYSSQDSNVYKIDNQENFYAVIDPKLADSLDKTQLDHFTNALKKGFVSKLHHSVGIKVITGKIIELKINGDLRLYTTEICKNTDGKYLINFSQKGNHDKIEKIAANNKLNIVTSDSQILQGDNIEVKHHEIEPDTGYFSETDENSMATLGDLNEEFG